jgi:hypothetical protein
MLGNGIYVSTTCNFWSDGGVARIDQASTEKFTLKNMTYGHTCHWIRIITSPPCQLAFSGGKSFHDNLNTFIRVFFELLWQVLS